MLSNSLGFALLTIPFISGIVDAISTNGDGFIQNQVVLHSADDPSPPVLKTITSGGILRSYRIQIPSDYDSTSDKEWPLIIDFHGRNGNAEGQWDNSKYYLNQDGKEYFVVYPNGCLGAGNRGGPPERAWEGAPYANTACDDLQFVSDLAGRVQSNFNIDSNRIYASGKSNGGGFVDTLACSSTGDLFAAFAMAAAALYTDNPTVPDNCEGRRPRAILEAHGTADDTIPITGRDSTRPGWSTPDIAGWTQRWAVRNHCDSNQNPATNPESWGINTTYSCNGRKNVIQQYQVTNMGHCWPTETENTDSQKHDDCVVQGLDFTQVVVDFFAAWEKGN